jgi:hypothetical protein
VNRSYDALFVVIFRCAVLPYFVKKTRRIVCGKYLLCGLPGSKHHQLLAFLQPNPVQATFFSYIDSLGGFFLRPKFLHNMVNIVEWSESLFVNLNNGRAKTTAGLVLFLGMSIDFSLFASWPQIT